MWVARNGSIASGCECDKAKWQDCSGRKAVVLPYQRGAVFSLSRNGSRHGKSTMVCQSTGRIFLHTRVPSSGNQSARTFQLFGRRGASTRYCSKPGYEPRYGFSNCLHGAGAPCAFGQITAEISSGMNLTLPATLEMKREHLQRTGAKTEWTTPN